MQVYRRLGNGIDVHCSANFSNEDIEAQMNHVANPERRKDGKLWKMAPITDRFPANRVPCGSDPKEIHVRLTANGEPFEPGSDPDPVAQRSADAMVEELLIMFALKAQAIEEGTTAPLLLRRIVKDYLKSKGVEL